KPAYSIASPWTGRNRFWPWLNRDARRYGRSPINVASWVMLPKKAFEWCLSVLSLQFDWVRAGPSDPARSAWARRRALESSWTADKLAYYWNRICGLRAE